MLVLLAIVAHGSGMLGSYSSFIDMQWTAPAEDLSFEVESTPSKTLMETDAAEATPSMNQVVEVSVTDPSSMGNPLEAPLEVKPELTHQAIEQVRGSFQAEDLGPAFVTTSVESRTGGRRQQAVAKNGGNPQSEKAVEAALLWLARHQNLDGGWSFHLTAPCDGQCQNPSTHSDPQRAAATGLSLLCFLGAGYTHQEGPYQTNVRDGLYFLTQIMKKDKRGGHFHQPIAQFALYEHGIATLALCEAYQMTHDPSLREICEDAIGFIYYSQHVDGGWGYDPKTPGDLSIACWQMMAIKSASAGKLKIPTASIKSFDRFLDSQQADNGAQYGYRNNKPKPSTTAMGLLMRLYRGWSKTDGRVMRGAQYVAKQGPSASDVYLNYYATQLMFQAEGRLWEDWNTQMRDFLIREQAQYGHEQGSWYFDSALNQVGGRLYTTAMCCMTLEVYYRHMPIYAPVEDTPFAL